MAFILKLFAVLGVVTLSSAGPAKLNPRRLESEGITETQPDTYQLVPQLPLGFQLPKEEPAELPFYSPEPSVELSVPRYEPNEQNYYQAPIPSSDLTVPVVTAWNPNNDPKYYFEVPAALTKKDYPTNSYPKKFNKELHSKDKPFSSKPKQEIELQPIDGAQYAIKQKELYKTFQKLAKKENQKQSKAEEITNPKQVPKLDSQKGFEPDTAYSNIHPESAETNFDDEQTNPDAEQTNTDAFSQGLSAQLTSSLGIPNHHSNGERLEFHMVGHDGPYSYKWGYDTGKGHNRQFRFEERDKEGIVKGHYGFYDKHGKLKMVNYDAHPHEGFHAESN